MTDKKHLSNNHSSVLVQPQTPVHKTTKSSLPFLIIFWGACAFFLCLEIIQLIRPVDFYFLADLPLIPSPILMLSVVFLILMITHLATGFNGLKRLFILVAPTTTIMYLSLLSSDFKLSWWFILLILTSFWLWIYFGLYLFLKKHLKLLLIWFGIEGGILLYLYVDREFFMISQVHLSLIHLWRWYNTGAHNIGLNLENLWPLIVDIAVFLFVSLVIGYAIPRETKVKSTHLPIAIAFFIQLICMGSHFNYIIEKQPFVEYLFTRFDASGIPLPIPSILQPLQKSGLVTSKFKLDPTSFYSDSNFFWKTSRHRNIIFLTLESVRAHEIEQNMPLLMKWAKRGIYFNHHSSASNLTETAVNSIYGSMYPFFLTKQFRRIKPWSFTKFLKDTSYQLYKVQCKWAHLNNEAFYKNFKMISLPEPTKKDPSRNYLPFSWFINISNYQLDKLAVNTADVLNRVKEITNTNNKYFIEGYLFNAHFNYSYPKEFAVHQPTLPARFMIYNLEPTPDNMLKLKNRYRNALGYIDYCLDKFLTSMYQNKTIEDTYIVIYGDHGQSLGESGFFGHVSGPHIYQFQVPCLILGPGVNPQEFNGISQHPDILPTLGELMGFSISGASGKNLFKEQRNFTIEQDNSIKNRFIVRRKNHMTIYDITSDKKVRWVITISNKFELNDYIMSLYKEPGLKNLKNIIAADFKQIAIAGRCK